MTTVNSFNALDKDDSPVEIPTVKKLIEGDGAPPATSLLGLITTLIGKDFSTQTTLAAVLAKLIAAPATEAKQDAIITALTSLQGYVDGVETLIGLTNTAMSTLHGYVDGLEGLQGTSNTTLSSINSALTALQGYVDALEGYTDGLETLIGTSNTSLASIVTNTAAGATQTTLAAVLAKIIAAPATEAKQDAGNTSLASAVTALTAIQGYVDQLEGYVDGLETLLGTTNTLLAAATPAGTNLLGKVAAGPDGAVVYDGTTPLTPKFAKVAISASGEIVAAVTSKKIRVLSLKLIANGTVNAKWQGDSGGTPVDLTGLSYFVANAGEVLPFSPVGHFETAAGKNLYLNLSASIAVGGHITYVEV